MKFLSTVTGSAINTKYIKVVYTFQNAIEVEMDNGDTFSIFAPFATEEEAKAELDRIIRALGGLI